ncbi:MAG: metallophosphoesterase family protein, partial [Promethearchaeota archaeon]
LRGNHEDQTINRYYGFYRNLKDYFIIQDRIDEIYGLILEFFMRLPIIHIFTLKSSNGEEKKIITVHGGIPVDIKNPSNPVSLDDLESKLIFKVPSSEQFDDYMWGLLWSDPKENVIDYESHPETGRNYFGESIFQKFMETNKLDLMVRAHEVLKEGYKFFFNKKLISLFSTSYYNNRKVGNAVIMRLKEKNGSFNSPEFISINESIMNNDIKKNF